MSDSGFIFQAGPVLGRKFWQDAEQGTDLLTWEPVFADISSSGDLGYTTGPWEFRAKRNDPDPAAGGYYVSVWKKEKNDWKVALDIGISYPWAAYPTFITDDTRIYRPGSPPFINDEQRNQLFSETNRKFSYEAIDAIVASSGDLGYVYGKAIIEITKDDNTKTVNGNYLRIWKKEDGTDWKIVLDLVNTPR